MAGEKIYIADKETLDKVYNILAVDPIYGFIEHMNILSPTQRIEYIGLNKNFTPVSRNTNGSISLNDWAGFEILEANKPYMVRSDGTPDYRLQDNDYTKKYSDGSASDVANTSYDGGAFSWLQKIYKNETVVGDDRIVKFSLTKRMRGKDRRDHRGPAAHVRQELQHSGRVRMRQLLRLRPEPDPDHGCQAERRGGRWPVLRHHRPEEPE